MKSFLKTLALVVGLLVLTFVPTQFFHLMNQPSTLLVTAGAVGLALFGWAVFKGGQLWQRW